MKCHLSVIFLAPLFLILVRFSAIIFMYTVVAWLQSWCHLYFPTSLVSIYFPVGTFREIKRKKREGEKEKEWENVKYEATVKAKETFATSTTTSVVAALGDVHKRRFKQRRSLCHGIAPSNLIALPLSLARSLLLLVDLHFIAHTSGTCCALPCGIEPAKKRLDGTEQRPSRVGAPHALYIIRLRLSDACVYFHRTMALIYIYTFKHDADGRPLYKEASVKRGNQISCFYYFF